MPRADRAAVVPLRLRAPDSRASEELSALHETTLDLLDRLDLESLLEGIVERAGALVGTPHGYLYVLDPGEASLTVRVGTGMFERNVGYRIGRGEGLAGRVWETGAPLVVDRYHRWAGRKQDLDGLAIGALGGVPLWRGEEVVGVLGLAYLESGRRFGDHEVAVLTRFAQLASIGLENASLYTAAQQELRVRRQAEDELLDTVARLRRSEHQLQLTHEEMVNRLAYATEFRSAEIGTHVERMSRLCLLLGRKLGLDEERCELLRIASPLHDVGKIGIPDSILLKPGPLTPQEREVMKEHTEIGRALLGGARSELLEVAATIAWTHHERFDGNGYPRGLAGEAIPLEGRIATVADVFDALTSDRVYRPAFSSEEAFEIMAERRGTQFDPLVLDLFLELTRDGDGIDAPAVAAHTARVPRPRSAAVGRRPADGGPLDATLLCAAVREAVWIVLEGEDPRRAVEAGFSRIWETVGPELLVSVYVLDHDRLWLLAQRGYREVRDGFLPGQGVMGRALRTGKMQFIPDVTADADFIAAVDEIRSELAIPFASPRGARGVLNFETIGRPLPPDAVEACRALARALAERADAVAVDLQPKVAKLARLCVYASSLRGVPAIADFATRTLGRLLDLDSAELNLHRDAGGARMASFWRRPDLELEPFSAAELDSFENRLPAGGEAYSALELPVGEDGQLVRVAWLPLRVGGGEIGTFIGRMPNGAVPEHERNEAGTLLVQHVAALIDVAQALQREQRAAVTEPLTGLLNRRGFDERLHEELRRAGRGGRSFAVAVADCDGLKEINDLAGHEAGDTVLQLAASCLRDAKRLEDVAARLGGDEFALLLPETAGAGALVVVERLRRCLEVEMSRAEHPLTATFGVAVYPDDGATVRELLRAADRALYRAKRQGKNRSLLSA